ncbi:UNC-50 family protein [Helicosporidium sp. ATCC 50920]|nr:UNC-50 family protein [Helicosporidium sp. ATCC 50920]|eukprot:KDD76873.1 UNC-50 family protein [Helicosporidium sp. ATCC 50920]
MRPRRDLRFVYSFWTMVQLVLSPKTAYVRLGARYRHTSYRKQTKNTWARDDPAFVVLLAGLLAVITLGYSIAFGSGFFSALTDLAVALGRDLVFFGCLAATAGWLLGNRVLMRQALPSHAAEQSVEWMYAFDVHCNALLPLVLELLALQLVLSPILLLHTRLAAVLSSLLYALGVSHYLYITFLGYSALPFLEHTEVFLYPISALVLLLPLAFLSGMNPTKIFLRLHFGYDSS